MGESLEQIVTVAAFDADGFGLTADAKRTRIRLALPGERLTTRAAGDFFLIKKILAAHPGRVVAPCPHFGRCGGCDLQQADYRLQLELKRRIVRDLFKASREPALRAAAEHIPAVMPSPKPFGYRQRLRLITSAGGRLAFRGFRSHQTVAIDHCPLARPEINAVLAALTTSKNFSALVTVVEEAEFLLNPDRGQIDLLLRLNRPSRPTDRDRARRILADTPRVGRIFFYGEQFSREAAICRADDHGDAPCSLTYPPSRALPRGAILRWPVGGFCQVNLEQNLALLELVISWASLNASDKALELFCGAGNFSIVIAKQAKSLIGVEGQGAAIRQAQANARLAQLANCRFVKANVHDFCHNLADSSERFSFILLDPPRAGIPGLAAPLARLRPDRLILISCDPQSLVRDLAALCHHGFSLEALQAIDMFPQTHHLETVALLAPR
ncbi:MAG: class I SAM-dependent RNA methyltransferase [Desulfobulbaceae bacterium]|jgi:23S rRNA (uracil1939-C5)-methyltransferase|nr:class I SAM-dependent RNA methyltransferase [Desulfobulbaceae bacterium]